MRILQGLEGCQLGDQWIPSGARWGHHRLYQITEIEHMHFVSIGCPRDAQLDTPVLVITL